MAAQTRKSKQRSRDKCRLDTPESTTPDLHVTAEPVNSAWQPLLHEKALSYITPLILYVHWWPDLKWCYGNILRSFPRCARDLDMLETSSRLKSKAKTKGPSDNYQDVRALLGSPCIPWVINWSRLAARLSTPIRLARLWIFPLLESDMAEKTKARYGSWVSPITSDNVVEQAISFSKISIDPFDKGRFGCKNALDFIVHRMGQNEVQISKVLQDCKMKHSNDSYIFTG